MAQAPGLNVDVPAVASDANAMAALAVGAYILVAIFRGNGAQLWTLIKGEAGFIKWGIAVALLWWIANLPEFKNTGLGPSLIGVMILGMAFKIADDPTILNSIKATWNALPNSTPA